MYRELPFLPLLSPLEGLLADDANLFREIGLLVSHSRVNWTAVKQFF